MTIVSGYSFQLYLITILFTYAGQLYYMPIPAEGDETTEPTPYPNCGSSESSDRETGQYVLEDGTKHRMTYCTACVREKSDGSRHSSFGVSSRWFVTTIIGRISRRTQVATG